MEKGIKMAFAGAAVTILVLLALLNAAAQDSIFDSPLAAANLTNPDADISTFGLENDLTPAESKIKEGLGRLLENDAIGIEELQISIEADSAEKLEPIKN